MRKKSKRQTTLAPLRLARHFTHLSKRDAILNIHILSLNITSDNGALGVPRTGDFERGREGRGLYFEGGAVDGVVFEEEVGGGFAEVLFGRGGVGCVGCDERGGGWGG
jgi:hypothetical protein